MQITKYTHACVRLEQGGGVLVIDPGIWSEPRALLGANAVLVTHEHVDHVDVLRLAGLGGPRLRARRRADRRTGGDPWADRYPDDLRPECTAAGFKVRAVGSRHAFIYDGQPDCANLGYVVEDRLYHPGDALHVPDQPIETLLVPVHGSWLRTDEAIDFVKAVKPQRTFAIHDAQLNERGLDGVNAWLAAEAASGYRYLAPGEAAA
jgi:L-ascorbate metabolism protein UlaG (beta-lactamase superfamily)